MTRFCGFRIGSAGLFGFAGLLGVAGLLGFVGLLTLSEGGCAQKKLDWKHDPYTEGDGPRMRRAGYVSFTPSAFRSEVVKELPNAKILWVETAHFIIGSSLEALPMPMTSTRRRRVVKELRALKVFLPSVKANPRTIDAWLRLHLYAFRVERIYDQMQLMLGVIDKDFPKDVRSAKSQSDPDFMGWGPYLGMRGKYRVLLLASSDDLARYRRFRTGSGSGKDSGPFQYFDKGADGLMYCTCIETYREQYEPAHALHCQVRFDIAHNLLKGYRHYDFVLPAWINEGIANVLLREFDPGQFAFSDVGVGIERNARNARWEGNSRRLVKNGMAPTTARLCLVSDPGKFTLNDHICSWSRVDYLRRQDEGRAFARFLQLLKAPHPMTGKGVPFENVLARQEKAFAKCFGTSWDDFDRGWREFALKNYPRK